MLLRARPGEGVGEPIVLGANPGGLGPVVVFDLIPGVDAGHPEPVIVSRPAVLDEPKTSFRVCENCDMLMFQLWPPDSDHQQMREQFEV